MESGWLASLQSAVAMLMVQLIGTGMQLLSKIILHDGTFVFALLTYRLVVASICVFPLAIFYEREMNRKMITWSVVGFFFVNSFLGITCAMGFYYYGLKDTSASYAANFTNLIPIVTYIMSILLRVEKLRLSSREGKIKLIGALLCFMGVLMTGLVKGKTFFIAKHHAHQIGVINNFKPNWIRGTCFLFGSCLCYAIWFVFQVRALNMLPLRYYATLLTSIMGATQAAFVGLVLNTRKDSWRLKWDLQLITILYSGALSSAANCCIVMWVIGKKGPTYPTMFTPLSLIFVMILEAALFGISISVGMVVGAALNITGLCLFFVGKNKEINHLTDMVGSPRERPSLQASTVHHPN